MELKQRRLFSRRTLRFDDTTLYISETTRATASREWTVRLDEIGSRYDVHANGFFQTGCMLAIFMVIVSTLIVISVSWTTSLVVLVIAFAPTLIGKVMYYPQSFEIPSKRGPIVIGFNRRTKPQVAAFVTSLLEASRNYYRWRYGTPDADLPYDKQVENLWWLRGNGFLTEEEYQQRKQVLKNLKNGAQ